MKIIEDESFWQSVGAHCSNADSIGAPWPVQVQVATLVGDQSIAASSVRYDGTTKEATSTWSVFVVTDDGRLAHVAMSFAASEFDSYAYQERRDRRDLLEQGETVDGTVEEAWVRRLADVVRLDFGRLARRHDSWGNELTGEYDGESIRLTFRGGDDLRLVLARPRDGYRCAGGMSRGDDLVAAVRRHTRL